MTLPEKNGRQLKKGDPLGQRIRALHDECKERGEKYPRITVDDLYSVPFVWMGPAPYHAETLERIYLTQQARSRPVILPDEYIIDGEAQLPGEKRTVYALYLLYRDLGPARTLTKVAELARGSRPDGTGGKGGAVTGYYTALATRFRWAERVAAYDSRMEIEARRAMEQVSQEQQLDAARRKQTYLDNEFAIVERGIERIKEMLEHPIVVERTSTQEIEGEDGELTVVHTTNIEPSKWTIASAAQLTGEITKLARLNLGLSTSNTAQKIESTASAAAAAHHDRSPEEQAAHEFAAARAEEAYFAALEEYQRTGGGRLTAHIEEAAD